MGHKVDLSEVIALSDKVKTASNEVEAGIEKVLDHISSLRDMASPGLCCVKRVSDICILESMIGVSSKNLMVMTCEPRFDKETTLEIVYVY